MIFGGLTNLSIFFGYVAKYQAIKTHGPEMCLFFNYSLPKLPITICSTVVHHPVSSLPGRYTLRSAARGLLVVLIMRSAGPGHFPLWTIPPGHFPPDNFPPDNSPPN